MKYLPVNWQDGMKIRKDHFVEMENAARHDQVNSVKVQLSPYSFGLLPVRQAEYGFDLHLRSNETDAHIILNSFNGVTEGGYIVEILPGEHKVHHQIEHQTLIQQLEMHGILYIQLSVSPYKRQTFGNPDPTELPPRFPYTIPSYQILLSHTPEASITREIHNLTIGRVVLGQGVPMIDKNYVPPCTSLWSHKTLMEYYVEWKRMIEQLEINCHRTITRVYNLERDQAPREKPGIRFNPQPNTPDELDKLDNELKEISLLFTEKLIEGLSTLIPHYRHTLPNEIPVNTFIAFQQLARKMQASIVAMKPDYRSEWHNFLSMAIRIESLYDTIYDMVEHQYQHNDIISSVQLIHKFLSVLSRIYDEGTGLPNHPHRWHQVTSREEVFAFKAKPRQVDLLVRN